VLKTGRDSDSPIARARGCPISERHQCWAELGRRVAARVIERGRADGSDAKWTGSVPTGPGKWNGTNPILPQMATWKTWVLASASEFRSPPPIAHDSPEKAAELAELKTFQRTPKTNAAAYFWEYAAGGLRAHHYWSGQIGRLVLEYRLDGNPPLAARAYALQNITSLDTGIACWDSTGPFAPSNSIRT
jgi:hypothetical protein